MCVFSIHSRIRGIQTTTKTNFKAQAYFKGVFKLQKMMNVQNPINRYVDAAVELLVRICTISGACLLLPRAHHYANAHSGYTFFALLLTVGDFLFSLK